MRKTFLPFTVTDSEDELTQIIDEEVPLVAVLDEEDEAVEELTEIEDEEVALAGAPMSRIWWSWIPVIGAAASTVDGYFAGTERIKKESGDSQK